MTEKFLEGCCGGSGAQGRLLAIRGIGGTKSSMTVGWAIGAEHKRRKSRRDFRTRPRKKISGAPLVLPLKNVNELII